MLFCVAFFLTLIGCSNNNVEGSWGLVHYEEKETVDGIITREYKGDCNPFSPSDPDWDLKLSIIHTNDNDYLVTLLEWNKVKMSWCPMDGVKPFTWTIKKNRIVAVNGQPSPEEVSINSNTFCLEETRSFGKSETSTKRVFRKIESYK
jgi:hypothetical protein